MPDAFFFIFLHPGKSMAYIKMISEDEAQGDVKSLYNDYLAPWGGVDNILKIHGLLPHTLKPHYDLYKSAMFGKGPLTRRQREMIAVVVSHANRCQYCIHHHSDALYRVTKDRKLSEAMRTDYRLAETTKGERVMLEFAEQLTREPGSDQFPFVQRLREHHFTDDAILHITLIISYFNFVNRIANGLGVELEGYWKEDGYSDPAKPMAHDDR